MSDGAVEVRCTHQEAGRLQGEKKRPEVVVGARATILGDKRVGQMVERRQRSGHTRTSTYPSTHECTYERVGGVGVCFSLACLFLLFTVEHVRFLRHVAIHSFIFIHSFIHLHSFIRLSVYLCIRPFMHSFIRSLVHSFIRLFTHSFTHSLIYSCVHSFIHSFIHPSIHSCMHSLIR
jgi:hypothetical protein